MALFLGDDEEVFRVEGLRCLELTLYWFGNNHNECYYEGEEGRDDENCTRTFRKREK